jgi:hypothetical protein
VTTPNGVSNAIPFTVRPARSTASRLLPAVETTPIPACSGIRRSDPPAW